MIHVCSLARLYATVDETGARHIVTLLRLIDRVQRPQPHCAGEPSGPRGRRHRRADRRLHRAGATSMSQQLIDFVARLGSHDADGGALLCRHQPLDRRRLVAACALNPERDETRNRLGLRRASRDRAAEHPHRRRSPTACSSATAAWCARSRPSGLATPRPKAIRSGSICELSRLTLDLPP